MYCCHNIINTKDLDALKDQLSFGSDKESIKKILSGITYSKAGEAVMYSPEFFRDDGYIVVGKIDTPRRTEHKGSNIEVKTKFSTEQPTTYYQGDFNTSDYGLTKPIDDFNGVASNHTTKNEYENDYSNDSYEYKPENYDFSVSNELMPMVKMAENAQNHNNQGVKTIAAIGLLSAGFYTVLRSIGKRK